jgi:formylglycine-generating enzyme required for sulfatase activity
MTYDLFISHSSEDAETAMALVADFENRNITCWVAPRDIPMGSSYHEEIVQAIENSRAVLLLFSGAANKSAHVLREVELAEQGRKPILPLRIDVSDPVGGLKYMLANKQWVERKALGNRLVETIEQLLGGVRPIRTGVDEARARPAPPKKKFALSPTVAVAGVVLVLLLGSGVAAWQGDWFGIEAKRLAQQDQLRKEQERKDAELREQERLRKEGDDQARRSELARQEQARKDEQARRDEQARQEQARQEQARKDEETRREEQARKEEQAKKEQEAAAREARIREARVEPAKLPFKKSDVPAILTTAPTVADAVPGKTFFRECDMCPVMAVIPAGSNIIGSPDDERGHTRNESPQQGVVFRVPLAVSRSEVAFEEYLACIAEGGCRSERPGDHDWGYGKQPAIFVSFEDAQRYVAWLSQKTKSKYRLLSEAEWEYAARGCAKVCESTPFWFGDDISKARANYNWRIAYLGAERAIPLMRTMPIDEAEANPFGLLHVHGNVAEWVEDCWNESLAGMTRDGTARTTGDCTRRVVRGGSWKDGPQELRSAKRSWEQATERREHIGFRIARELKL